MRRLALVALLLFAPAVAFADVAPGPGQCIQYDYGCGGCQHGTECAPGVDMTVSPPIHDLATPRDLSSPPDARLERVRRRNRAHGRGLVLLSGVSALAVLALRRRYRMIKPTPAENALAASATRRDS